MSFAQVWSLNELITVANMNVDDADTYIVKNGYTFSSAKNESDGETRIYAYNKSSAENIASYWFDYFTYNKESKYKVGVSWETTNTQQYSDLKFQIKPMGFEFKTSRIINPSTTVSEYIKGKYILELKVVNSSEEYNRNLIQYLFKLTIIK